jgi:hypothetical protein
MRAHAVVAGVQECAKAHIFPAFDRMMMVAGDALARERAPLATSPPLLGLKRSKDAFVACWVYYL